MVIGIAGTNGVVSLGDGGSAICTFQYPIKNGIGNDFAVFENSFDDTFLELAFVEVSSDGINFVRFPSHSLTDTTLQTNTFGTTDATKINNLAGKYRSSYGTPFDLQELSSNPILNINYITHVKIIDVVGSVNKQYAKRDSYNNMINDPWPTPFPNGGFDLDAIGVIHQNTSVGLKENNLDDNLYLYPNPINKGEKLLLSTSKDILFVSILKETDWRRFEELGFDVKEGSYSVKESKPYDRKGKERRFFDHKGKEIILGEDSEVETDTKKKSVLASIDQFLEKIS